MTRNRGSTRVWMKGKHVQTKKKNRFVKRLQQLSSRSQAARCARVAQVICSTFILKCQSETTNHRLLTHTPPHERLRRPLSNELLPRELRTSKSLEECLEKSILRGSDRIISNGQALKAVWKAHSFEALVEPSAKRQALKTAWKGHSFQIVVEPIAQGQALKTAWKGHSLEGLVKPQSKSQVFEARREVVQVLPIGCP
jgi:hypothetical protein